MDGRQVAQQLREIIQNMKDGGAASVDVDALLTYLLNVESSPDAVATVADQDRLREDQENARVEAKMAHEIQLAEYQMVNAAGEAAAKALFLLNGGGAIAMLAFVGQLAAQSTPRAAPFGQPLLGFGWGALTAVGLYGGRFLAHFAWGGGEDWHRKLGTFLNWICIALGIGSLLLFGWSLFAANGAFQGLSV